MYRGIAKAVAMNMLAITILLGFASGGGAAEPESSRNGADAGNYALSIQVNGLQRHYVVHVPGNHVGNKPLPVVIVFHGGGGTAKNIMWGTEWTGKADQEGFLAVFPEGTRPIPSERPSFLLNPQTWNDGSNRAPVGAVLRKIDDVGFVRALIDDLIARYNVDQHRIYATGFSNGASMAFRVGRELSHRIAAIAPVAGADWLEQPMIRESVSLLYLSGTADPLNPLKGGEIRLGSRSMGHKPPVRQLIQKWVKMLGCSHDQKVICDKDGVKGRAYSRCKDGAEVIFYTVEGMGHAWPGGRSLLPESIVGKPSDRINANDIIWEFFRNHPKK
ncbi:MAG: alpha/beta hydrolase family esterase [Desulfomonilaceae bacterium]